ncbi:hypothetical protein [Frateuria defendens]|uniref:hypothetical protein n=1 Tax=Frateuria defendens TaxID=2219559 RepID=UPI00066FDCE4|nr:hypothetical protein [Frateuria defendens]
MRKANDMGKARGGNTRRQGGSGRRVAKSRQANASDSLPGKRVDVPGPALDRGDEGAPPTGFTGDDGAYQPGGSLASSDAAARGQAEIESHERGRSGTGQELPHHGLDDPEGEAFMALGRADRESPEGRSGQGYQSGGSGAHREQHARERKARGGAGGRSPYGGADPAPGAPAERGR